MSVSAFNPTAYTTNNAVPTQNAAINAAPTENAASYATDSYTAAPTANAPAANYADPAANTGIEGLPTVAAPTANVAAPTANAPVANTLPTANAPVMNQAPTANAPVVSAPAPVQTKSTGGFLGSILAAAGGGLLALKGIVPKFFPTLLQNASKLKIGGIFGIGALAGSLIFGLVKSKLGGPKPDAASAASAPSANDTQAAIAQVQQLLAQGVPPQELMKAGVPAEVLRQLGAQV